MEEIKKNGQPYEDGLTDADFDRVPDRSAIVDAIRPSMRYWPEVGKRLLKNKVAVFSVLLLLVIVLMAILVPILSPYKYDATNYRAARQLPSWEHPFGTDKVGRDMFTRVFMGARTSLIIGLVGALLPYMIGMTIGGLDCIKDTYHRQFLSEIKCLALTCEPDELRRRMTEGRHITDERWLEGSREYNEYFRTHNELGNVHFDKLDITRLPPVEAAEQVLNWVKKQLHT